MLRVDEMLQELARVREESFAAVNVIKQKKKNIPAQLEQLKEKARVAQESRAESSADDEVALPNAYEFIFEHKDHFYYEHNTIISVNYNLYIQALLIKTLGYIDSLSKSTVNSLDDLNAVISKVNQINQRANDYVTEMLQLIALFQVEVTQESAQVLPLIQDLLANLTTQKDSYKELTDLLIAKTKSEYEVKQWQLEQSVILDAQLRNNFVSKEEKDKALRIAALSEMKLMIDVLIKHHADITAQGAEYQMNALHFVCRSGSVACFEALLKSQSPETILKALRAKDVTNRTPNAYIRELADEDVKKQMLALATKYVLPNRDASQLHRLRSMSYGSPVNAADNISNASLDDMQYKSPKKYCK